MAASKPPAFSTAETHPGEQDAGLPRLVLESRARLGPEATPERVAEDVRAQIPEVTVEEVRQTWDEGHLPVG